MTGAPLALGDRVVVGVAGGDFGIRGFVAAYAARDGQLLWKFNTVPGPGEAGHDTWAGDSWRTGGAPTWTTGAYDAKLNLLYWGVGNPAPVFQGGQRAGDNLYSNSVVALDALTGKLRWHFQFTPGTSMTGIPCSSRYSRKFAGRDGHGRCYSGQIATGSSMHSTGRLASFFLRGPSPSRRGLRVSRPMAARLSAPTRNQAARALWCRRSRAVPPTGGHPLTIRSAD